ncbi:hypothetical protein IQ244_01785 [Nostoc sp. LEGE 06077]|uniref:hypothetical protein n=1 Tax=Nostoc sp. LEGE 06077 TaxID=915325 RepID=UPI00187FF4CD|nr:hypothetical protein [Nostoc sp. LEGE 06077]MBE9205279.1 hypothetical protein [Nostoc sp. LEGE 06077]
MSILEIFESLLKLAFGTEYYTLLKGRIKDNDKRDIISLQDLAIKHPDFKDKVIEIAKSKLKSQSEGLDQKYEESVTKKFMNFDQGLKLIKTLLDSVTGSGFGNTEITDMILSTFKSTVCTEGALWFVEYHTGRKTLELYKVEEVQNSDRFRIFYLNMEVDSKKINNFLYNESETKLKAKCKVKSFANLQSLLEWSAN